jgi:hypothetical protein
MVFDIIEVDVAAAVGRTLPYRGQVAIFEESGLDRSRFRICHTRGKGGVSRLGLRRKSDESWIRSAAVYPAF